MSVGSIHSSHKLRCQQRARQPSNDIFADYFDGGTTWGYRWSQRCQFSMTHDQSPRDRSGDAKRNVPSHSSPGTARTGSNVTKGRIASDRQDELRLLDLTANLE